MAEIKDIGKNKIKFKLLCKMNKNMVYWLVINSFYHSFYR